jgi:hypothetical protein
LHLHLRAGGLSASLVNALVAWIVRRGSRLAVKMPRSMSVRIVPKRITQSLSSTNSVTSWRPIAPS